MNLEAIMLKIVEKFTMRGLKKAFRDPSLSQEHVLKNILRRNESSLFGKRFNFSCINDVESYQDKVPVMDYKKVRPFIDLILDGVEDVLFCGKLARWIKTSGSSGEAKLYPISDEREKMDRRISIRPIVHYLNEGHESLLDGKVMFIAAPSVEGYISEKSVGYISGMIATNLGYIIKRKALFDKNVLNVRDMSVRERIMIEKSINDEVSGIVGIPPFIISFLKKIMVLDRDSLVNLHITTRKMIRLKKVIDEHGYLNLRDVFEKVGYIGWSGVNIEPYKYWFDENLGDLDFIESYYGSERLYTFQMYGDKGLTMNIDSYFFELIELEDFKREYYERVPLDTAKKGTDYVLLVTSNSGLYSYIVGDVVRVVNLNPPMVKVRGRIGKEVNLASEKVKESDIEDAITYASKKVGCSVSDFVLIPTIKDGIGEYLIYVEFDREPKSLYEFEEMVDRYIGDAVSSYRTIRDMGALKRPRVIPLKRGSFDRLYRKFIEEGKPYGQFKVLKVIEDDELIRVMETMKH
ncbi:MAG: GH3 auxin-responsive promoter family protein [Candidatus Odinarchaeota archaeon]|nr:GH3 auxin-responsive promoter family protein [Candidatus Odinarchaeota archaeon]